MIVSAIVLLSGSLLADSASLFNCSRVASRRGCAWFAAPTRWRISSIVTLGGNAGSAPRADGAAARMNTSVASMRDFNFISGAAATGERGSPTICA